MSRELFTSLMEQLRDIGFQGRVSYHFYNEPMLSPDLDLFVGLTREYLPRAVIELYTNGLLLERKRFDELRSLGVDKFTVTRHHGVREFPFAQVYEKMELQDRERVRLLDYTDLELTSRGGILKVGRRTGEALDLPCLIPSLLMVVTVNGNVLPCYEDFEERNVMGNLQRNSLVEIWNSPEYRGFRDSLKRRQRQAHAVCKTCNRQSLIS
jgi:radical SAM protein with 4Fe4S-binding SPASM domain